MKGYAARGAPITTRTLPPSPLVSRIAVERVIIVPGNGCTQVMRCNFYAHIATQLRQRGFTVVLEQMPDPIEAKERVWLPFLTSLGAGPSSLIIGHSSGAEAAMRLAERTELAGIVLVSPCHSDMGLDSEAISGYYNRPWQWETIRRNAKHIGQFSAPDDELVPFVDEQWVVHEQLQSELCVLPGQNHFIVAELPELVDYVAARFSPASLQ